jgi:hypothetical protein
LQHPVAVVTPVRAAAAGTEQQLQLLPQLDRRWKQVLGAVTTVTAKLAPALITAVPALGPQNRNCSVPGPQIVAVVARKLNTPEKVVAPRTTGTVWRTVTCPLVLLTKTMDAVTVLAGGGTGNPVAVRVAENAGKEMHRGPAALMANPKNGGLSDAVPRLPTGVTTHVPEAEVKLATPPVGTVVGVAHEPSTNDAPCVGVPSVPVPLTHLRGQRFFLCDDSFLGGGGGSREGGHALMQRRFFVALAFAATGAFLPLRFAVATSSWVLLMLESAEVGTYDGGVGVDAIRCGVGSHFFFFLSLGEPLQPRCVWAGTK